MAPDTLATVILKALSGAPTTNLTVSAMSSFPDLTPQPQPTIKADSSLLI